MTVFNLLAGFLYVLKVFPGPSAGSRHSGQSSGKAIFTCVKAVSVMLKSWIMDISTLFSCQELEGLVTWLIKTS